MRRLGDIYADIRRLCIYKISELDSDIQGPVFIDRIGIALTRGSQIYKAPLVPYSDACKSDLMVQVFINEEVPEPHESYISIFARVCWDAPFRGKRKDLMDQVLDLLDHKACWAFAQMFDTVKNKYETDILEWEHRND